MLFHVSIELYLVLELKVIKYLDNCDGISRKCVQVKNSSNVDKGITTITKNFRIF